VTPQDWRLSRKLMACKCRDCGLERKCLGQGCKDRLSVLDTYLLLLWYIKYSQYKYFFLGAFYEIFNKGGFGLKRIK
jgi:hypothetical protein